MLIRGNDQEEKVIPIQLSMFGLSLLAEAQPTEMNDSLNIFEQLNPWVIQCDTTISVSDSLSNGVPIEFFTFLQTAPIEIVPKENLNNHFGILIYILFFLLAGISILRWYMPDRFYYEFSVGDRFSFSRGKGNVVNAPGIIVDMFFWLNFLITHALLAFFLLEEYTPYFFLTEFNYKLFLFIFLAIASFWFYRRMVIKIISFIFQAGVLSERQLKLDRNVENALGVVLLPLLILSIFSFHTFFLILALLIALGMQVFRWAQTVGIGISSTRFTMLHFILYLCSLELIPLFIVFKLLYLGSLS
ncbi:MAG: hypothetical protein CVT99_07895 [Bacteroidetes bacterium HGW-Bacteroidetes-16]|jgi:hypothetical protein|nr:MAG: hypothetical protein CVT99_07895 [Bacteroidetes bacterium HGW-Bacteroidetes-16]